MEYTGFNILSIPTSIYGVYRLQYTAYTDFDIEVCRLQYMEYTDFNIWSIPTSIYGIYRLQYTVYADFNISSIPTAICGV